MGFCARRNCEANSKRFVRPAVKKRGPFMASQGRNRRSWARHLRLGSRTAFPPHWTRCPERRCSRSCSARDLLTCPLRRYRDLRPPDLRDTSTIPVAVTVIVPRWPSSSQQHMSGQASMLVAP